MSTVPTDPMTADRVRARELRRVVRESRAAKLQLVRFLYCGNDGVIRGKACHTRFLPSFLESGVGLTVAMQSFNMLDQLVAEGSFGPVGEIRLTPDPGAKPSDPRPLEGLNLWYQHQEKSDPLVLCLSDTRRMRDTEYAIISRTASRRGNVAPSEKCSSQVSRPNI